MYVVLEDIHPCYVMFYETGEQLEKRGNELASLSNEISSLVASQTLQIQDLEKMTSDQVMPYKLSDLSNGWTCLYIDDNKTVILICLQCLYS